MKKGLYAIMAMASLFLATSTRVDASANTGEMMRYYNKNKGTYLFTVNAAEIEKIKNFSYLEPQGAVFTTAKSGTKLYRFYHQKTGRYVFTGKQDEIEKMKKNGWVYEGFAFYSGGNVPITRLYHPTTGQHFYTGNVYEVHAFVRKGWINEGIGFFAISANRKDVYEEILYEYTDKSKNTFTKEMVVKNDIIVWMVEKEAIMLSKPLTQEEVNKNGQKIFKNWFDSHDSIKVMKNIPGISVIGYLEPTKYNIHIYSDFSKISASYALSTNLNKFQDVKDYVIGDKFELPFEIMHKHWLGRGLVVKRHIIG